MHCMVCVRNIVFLTMHPSLTGQVALPRATILICTVAEQDDLLDSCEEDDWCRGNWLLVMENIDQFFFLQFL